MKLNQQSNRNELNRLFSKGYLFEKCRHYTALKDANASSLRPKLHAGVASIMRSEGAQLLSVNFI